MWRSKYDMPPDAYGKELDRLFTQMRPLFLSLEEDVRLKMCVQSNAEDFQVVHHELGHDYYFLAYAKQPYLFRDSANDGFHEAIGDAVALSITPAYLVKLGLLAQEPPPSKDIG